MTRKHFEGIAHILLLNKPEGNRCYHEWSVIVKDMANLLSMYNPYFDTARFYVACGLEEEL